MIVSYIFDIAENTIVFYLSFTFFIILLVSLRTIYEACPSGRDAANAMIKFYFSLSNLVKILFIARIIS